MTDRKTIMLDAGTVRFRTQKPFGTVLGGLKAEMRQCGTVLQGKEADPQLLPPGCGPCDLFLDSSTPLRKRYIAATVEDAGPAGETSDGEPVRWYAVTFKEGNRNTPLRTVPTLLLAALLLSAPFFCHAPRMLSLPAGLALSILTLIVFLRPSRKTVRTVARLKETVRQGK